MAILKGSATNPKVNLLQGIYKKLQDSLVRQLGEMARIRVNPKAAEAEYEKIYESVSGLLADQLGRTNLPVVDVAKDKVVKGQHWLTAPLTSRRNVLYARPSITTTIALIEADGTCALAAVLNVLEPEMTVIVEAGQGARGETRFRCGTRTDLAHTLMLTPWKTVDVVKMNLLKLLDDEVCHTRKGGQTIADVVEVACGRADGAIATQVNRLEALVANLLMAEAGGFASDAKGKPVGPESDSLVVANPKLHSKLVALLK